MGTARIHPRFLGIAFFLISSKNVCVCFFIRYHKLTGKTVMDGVRLDRMETGDSTTTVVSTASLTPTAFRAPRYKFSIEKSRRAVIVPVSP